MSDDHLNSLFFYPLTFTTDSIELRSGVHYSFDLESITKLLKTKLSINRFIIYHFPPSKETKNSFKYYSKEMGENLSKLLFLNLDRENSTLFAEKKRLSNLIEQEFFKKGTLNRSLNLDVGRLNLESMELASRKKYSHRILLERDVYSDLHYIFSSSSFSPMSWAYPDYKQEKVIAFFNYARQLLFDSN